MFRFFQFISVVILFLGSYIVFIKKEKRSKHFFVGICIVLFVSSIYSGIILDAIPMPTEIVQIEATGKKNIKSNDNAVGLKGVIVDGKEYPLEFSEEGAWFYSKKDAAYLWLNENSDQIESPLPKEVTVKIPVGAGRKLLFLSGDQFGTVNVSYETESKTYDLYKSSSSEKRITVPDSNKYYDDSVKICRIGLYVFMILFSLLVSVLLVKYTSKESLIKFICIILSLISALTFFLNLKLTNRSGYDLYALFYDFNRSFSGNYVLGIILVPLLYKAFLYCVKVYREKFCTVRGTVCIAVPAGIFAAFLILGEAFINGDNTLTPIFGNELQLLKSLFAVIGYFSIFFFGITCIFNLLENFDICRISDSKWIKPLQIYLDCLSKRPFRTAMVTLIILYIPYIIASYPGIFMGDAKHHLSQIYGAYALNDAHPVVYTLFVGLLVKSGHLIFGSVNAGIYMYSVFQFLFMITTISTLIKLLTNLHISNKAVFFLLMYYGVHPRMQSYMCLMTKDIMNGAFLLIFITSLYMLITKRSNRFVYIILGLSDLGAILFRHDSKYVVAISALMIAFLIKEFRKQALAICASTLGFMLIWSNIVLPAANVLPTHPWYASRSFNTGFLASIMEQQTARYLRDAGDEITEEEKEILSSCFDYEKIVLKYEPDHQSDGVAGTIRSTISQDDWRNYQIIWAKMFFKHPEIYLEATLNHKYQFLYPRLLTTETYSYGYSKQCMDYINETIPEICDKVSYPKSLTRFRGIYEGLRESFFRVPVFNLFFATSFLFWILFIWLSYCVFKKDKVAISIMSPLLVLIFVLIAGPCNGRYFRYVYSYAFALFPIVLLGLHNMSVKKVALI